MADLIPLAGWIPWRVRERWNSLRVDRALRGVLRSPPLPAAAPEEARAEVHLLVCRRDVLPALVALKSLLRFRERLPLAVALTDDGSLGRGERALFERHIPGVAWHPPTAEKILATLRGQQPELLAFYESSFPFAKKLLHPMLLNRCERVATLDTDTAFLRMPEQFARWARGDGPEALYLIDRRDEDGEVPEEVRDTFKPLMRSIEEGTGRAAAEVPFFFNAGFLAYAPARWMLDVAERYIGWQKALTDPRLKSGIPGIWFGDWTREQTAYRLVFSLLGSGAAAFEAGYEIGRHPEAVFCHFLRHYYVQTKSLSLLRRTVSSLWDCGRTAAPRG